MSNLVEFAKSELNRLLKTCTDSEDLKLQQNINDDILRVIKQFGEQGHTGTTARYCISILTSLLNWRPLSPLTGEDSEWEDVSSYYGGKQLVYQNKRCPAVFKEDGKCYNVEGKIFTEDGGHTWYTCKDSRVEIEFPYNVPTAPEEVSIDKTTERSEVLKGIFEVFDGYSYLYDPMLVNEETLLSTIVPKVDLPHFIKAINEKFKISKPIWNFEVDGDDSAVWNLINYIMDSDKEGEQNEED